ncbi:MAG TPA: hypothetical protein VFA71_02495 [Terriglobales bacterium]|nr:hypothetical protein [Terriglobales bacterium]
MKIRFFMIVLVIFAAIQVHAGGASCATATGLAPDGSILDFDNIQPSSGNWYQFTATAGRSYSIQVRDDVDPDNSDLTVTYYGPNSTCTNLQSSIPTSIASVTDTHTTEPALPASASRSSIVTCAANYAAPCTGNGGGTYWIKVQNNSTATSHYVSIGVTETTIYGSTWNANINTQFLIQNTSSQSIAYTLTLAATAGGTQTYTTSGTLGAVATSTSLLNWSTNGNITAGQLGIAIFTHNAPPGAVQALEWWYNYSTNPITLMPVPIGPMRGK